MSTFNPQPKNKPFRSAKIMEAAKYAPECFACHRPNDGTVVGCHPNGLKYGKGMGLKSSDFVAYLCGGGNGCHDKLDGRSGNLTRQEKDEMFLDAFYWSTVWLIRTGRLQVK